jgi:hypothetical protein
VRVFLRQCAYCLDMHSKDARAEGETEQRPYALDAWSETAFSSERERGRPAVDGSRDPGEGRPRARWRLRFRANPVQQRRTCQPYHRLNSTSPSALCLEDTSRVCSGPNSARRNRSQAHLIEVVAALRHRSQVPAC